ncbi:bone morphogenetic protein 2-like [Brienomyrus brachyistius]|uniref:bone morphogenetic protein 2-like n=1 Tax=Brienomyrus brachyistius TaxID=42636 RepID=UPI0020B28B2B|nr:bone morphogenetic protein 2-like [Brienomyrus brachyistius]
MLTWLLVLLQLLRLGVSGPVVNPLEKYLTLANESDDVRSEALKRLLEVFGMEDVPPARAQQKQPPQYMLDLYNTVADVDGVTKDPGLLQGNTVRSFFDKLHSEQIQFLFNLTTVAKNEKVLTAELHLFKVRPQVSLAFNRHHFCQVSIYQLDNRQMNPQQNRRLLSSRLIPVHSIGWEVFSITHAVRSWMLDEGNDLGLMVTVRTLGVSQVDSKLVRFASGQDHHHSKQPMLVLFTDDGRRTASLESSLKEPEVRPAPSSRPHGLRPEDRRRRSPVSEDEEELPPCQRFPLYVDFEEIGWSSWVVSPRGYNAYHCKGSCFFPLGQNMRPTNHATVQSIIHALKLTEGISTPCCVPDKLFSINLLYFDDDENVVLKQYDDMVAASCGCQ